MITPRMSKTHGGKREHDLGRCRHRVGVVQYVSQCRELRFHHLDHAQFALPAVLPVCTRSLIS